MNGSRIYVAALAALGLLTAFGAGVLLFLTGASLTDPVETMLPAWSFPWIAAISFAYVIAITVTLCARRLKPATGRNMTRALNWALLPAFPGGTIVGLYGLLRVDLGSRPTGDSITQRDR